MHAADAIAWTTRHHAPAAEATALAGGLVNHVFRVRLVGAGSVVLKHAPPYVATRPQVPLDAGRAEVEAAALAWVGSRGGPVPGLLAAAGPTLLMEDLGDLPHLGAFLRAGGDVVVLDRLARWLRALHDGPAPELFNRSIQETRLALQYGPAGAWLAAAGVRDGRRLGAALRRLGERLLEPGDCFVMGDLWPPSVLVDDGGGFALIDWEMATVGRRCQDVGHLLAHLDLLAASGGPALADRFVAAYGPVSVDDDRDTALHRAAEVLARTVGSFPMADLGDDTRAVLVDRAAARIRRVAVVQRAE